MLWVLPEVNFGVGCNFSIMRSNLKDVRTCRLFLSEREGKSGSGQTFHTCRHLFPDQMRRKMWFSNYHESDSSKRSDLAAGTARGPVLRAQNWWVTWVSCSKPRPGPTGPAGGPPRCHWVWCPLHQQTGHYLFYLWKFELTYVTYVTYNLLMIYLWTSIPCFRHSYLWFTYDLLILLMIYLWISSSLILLIIYL